MVVLLPSPTLQVCKEVEEGVRVIPATEWIPYLKVASCGFPMGIAIDDCDTDDKEKAEEGRPSYANGSVFVVQTYFNGE